MENVNGTYYDCITAVVNATGNNFLSTVHIFFLLIRIIVFKIYQLFIKIFMSIYILFFFRYMKKQSILKFQILFY